MTETTKRWLMTLVGLVLLAGCQNQIASKDNTDWYHARAKILYGVALEHFDAGQLDEAHNKTQEALSLNPQFLPAQLLLGKICIEQDRYVEAVGVLSELHEKLPNSAEVLYLLGVAQERSGDLAQALASYRRAYALDTSDLSPVMAAAEVLVSLGRVREAQLYIESYLTVAGSEAGMFELAGRLAAMRDEHEKAAKYYAQAHDLDYKNTGYLESLAREQFLAGLYEEAIDSLKALAENDDYRQAAWVQTMLGDSYMTMGKPIDARDAYQRALDLDADSPAAWVNLAQAALAAHDETRAVLSAQQALKLEPTNIDAKLVMGYALVRSGRNDRAVRFLTEAIVMHPKNATLRCLLGRAFESLGNQAQAVENYCEALRLEPSSGLARQLLAGIGQ